jgi:hypothetical protein
MRVTGVAAPHGLQPSVQSVSPTTSYLSCLCLERIGDATREFLIEGEDRSHTPRRGDSNKAVTGGSPALDPHLHGTLNHCECVVDSRVVRFLPKRIVVLAETSYVER